MNRLRTVNGVSVIALASMMVGSLPANAQQSEMALLRQQIADMTERLNKMEADAKKATDAAAKAGPAATAKFPVTVSGLLQVQANTLFGQSGPAASTPDTFRLRRGEVRITGRIAPRITGTIMVDPAKNLTLITPAAPAAPSVNQSSNILQELNLTYHVKQDPQTPIFLDAGQFKIPVGYEGDKVSSSALPFINRALMYTVRDPFAGGYGDIRETGLRLRGSASPQFEYDLGVFNGFGDRQNALAASDAKAVMGRLIFHPGGSPDISLGVSGATGNTAVTGSAVRADRTLYNAFAIYRRDKMTAMAEYLQGDSQPLGGGSTRNVRSYYGSVGYLFRPNIEGVARYDYFDTDRNSGGFDVTDISLGLNYYIKGNNAKIQANVVHRDGTGTTAGAAGTSSSGLGSIANDSTAFIIQGQVAF